jgi:hypothetical protein
LASGEVVNDHSWIVDVLKDIREYAQLNHLVEIEEQLTNVARAALIESEAYGKTGPHTELLSSFIGGGTYNGPTPLDSFKTGTVEIPTEPTGHPPKTSKNRKPW